MSPASTSSRNWRIASALAVLTAVAFGLLVARARSERSSLTIRLRWVRSYDSESWNDVQTGLLWSLSFLGARLERPLENLIVRRRGDASRFDLHLDQAGFSTGARRSLATLLSRMKGTGEYQHDGAFDLGRFVALTLGRSWNYYAVTQAARTLDEFEQRHNMDRAETFPLVISDLANHSRVLHFSVAPEVEQMAFAAEELSGKYGEQGVRALGQEVMDVMPNGQLRFAIYDGEGRLTEGTPPEQSAAGKPAKCLWCHEINIFSLFRDTPDTPGYMSAAMFSATMARAREVVARHRQRLHALVDFERKQDHTQAELLYIAYMEPSAERLSREWGIDVADVKKRMAGRSTHVYAEFPFLGALYDRRIADAIAGNSSLPPPVSVREPSGREADSFGYALR